MRLALWALLAVPVVMVAESKTEAALRIQLEAAAARNASLTKALAASTSANTANKLGMQTLAVESKTQASTASDQRIAAGAVTEVNDADARATAVRAKNAADLANTKAELAVALAKNQSDALLTATNSSKFALYGSLAASLFTFLAVVAGYVAKDRADQRAAAILAAHDEKADAKIEQIHTLVNSNLTAEMQLVYNAQKELLGIRQGAIDQQRASGEKPSDNDIKTLDLLRQDLSQKANALQDRRIQTEGAAALVAAEERKAKA